jgi:hypothetical protein
MPDYGFGSCDGRHKIVDCAFGPPRLSGLTWWVPTAKSGAPGPSRPSGGSGRFQLMRGSKKAPTKPGLQLPIRRTRPVLGSDNYDARLVRRRQSNIANYPLAMRAPAPDHSAPEPPKERSLSCPASRA